MKALIFLAVALIAMCLAGVTVEPLRVLATRIRH
jgi:hypothetical protein